MTARRGLFVTLEGGEGAGKTTQVGLLVAALRDAHIPHITTREPGGSPEGERIRDLFVRKEGGRWTPVAESLLLFAARVMNLETRIRPALEAGQMVICDRFTDSTRAYQCFGHGLDRSVVEDLNRVALGGFRPDITLILDLPAEVGLERARREAGGSVTRLAGEDKFEGLGLEFHRRLREGYLTIAREEPDRCVVLDAQQDVSTLHRQILDVLLSRWGSLRHVG